MSSPDDPATTARLRVDQADDGTYRVLLDGTPLHMLLAADGLTIRFEDDEFLMRSVPVVEMKFAPGALFVDLDADLVADILRHNETAGA